MNLKREAISSIIPLALSYLAAFSSGAAPLPIVEKVEAQPLAAQIERLREACDYIGSPFSDSDRRSLEEALQRGDATKAQQILDERCLFGVHINPEMRVKVQQGPAKPELVEQGWRDFL